MKGSIALAPVLAQSFAQSTPTDHCKTIKWNGDKIPFMTINDGQVYTSEHLLEKYEEKKDELSLGRCMRKCFRYAGCVAFNFYDPLIVTC